jgi:hypothetical protein
MTETVETLERCTSEFTGATTRDGGGGMAPTAGAPGAGALVRVLAGSSLSPGGPTGLSRTLAGDTLAGDQLAVAWPSSKNQGYGHYRGAGLRLPVLSYACKTPTCDRCLDVRGLSTKILLRLK